MRYLSGELPKGEIIRVLRLVHLGHRTGVLEIGPAAARKRLYFVSGELYLPNTHPLARRLATYLRGLGLAGLPGEGAVRAAGQGAPEDLRELTRRIAEHVASWDASSYLFSDGLEASTPQLVGPLPTAMLLMDAAALNSEDEALIERLGGIDVVLAGRLDTASELDSDLLGSDEAHLLSLLERPIVLGELLADLDGERRRWLEALNRLWAVDLVRRSQLPPLRAAAAEQPQAVAAAATAPSEPPPASEAIWQDHYRLQGEPFSLTPDPAFLYLSDSHAEALSGLKLGLLEGRGLIVMVGEVGTGKTTLVYSLLSALDPQVETAYVSNTSLTMREILQTALRDFGLPVAGERRIDLLESLNGFLRRSAEVGKTVALVIDEAQNLSDSAFEQLRLLLNFETYKKKLLQIVLSGQPELGIRLRQPQLRQLADRIAIRCQLEPLSPADCRCYVAHRLEAVGGSPDLFSRGALALVARKSRGIPRRINVLCHNAMLYAYGRGEGRVDRSLVAEAAREMQGEVPPLPSLPDLRRWGRLLSPRRLAGGAA